MKSFFGIIKNLFSSKEKKNKSEEIRTRVIDLTEDEAVSVLIDEAGRDRWDGKIYDIGELDFAVDIPDLIGTSPFPYKEGEQMLLNLERDSRVAYFRCQFNYIDRNISPPVIVLSYPDQIEWKTSVKRKHLRIDVDIPAKARINLLGEEWKSVRIKDFSMSGLSFNTKETYRKGDEVLVELLSLPEKLELPGKVIRVIELGEGMLNIGILFINLNPVLEQSIANFAWKMQKRGLE